MENASKALLMAAGVLISLMIISLAVYLFASFGKTSREKHEENKQQQIQQFNSQFTSYQSKDCTIYDVITVINLAAENNKYYGYSTRNQDAVDGKDSYISIVLSGISVEDSSDFETMIRANSQDNGSLTAFVVEKIEISKYTNKVYKVVFKQKI